MKPIWLVGAAAVLVFLLVRRRQGKLTRTVAVVGAIAAVAALVYGLGLVTLPNVEELLTSIGEKLGTWTYLLVGALAFLETGAGIGLVAPGESAILVGGVVAGQGQIDIVVLIGIVWACAVAGDVTSFLLGRRLGRPFLVRHGPKVQITEERLEAVERFFDKHGGAAIFLGRFVGLVRAIAPFLAGSGGMPLRRFLPYDVLGAGLWGTTFCLLGYVFWQSLDQVLQIAKQGSLALAAVIVVVVGGVAAYRYLRVPEHREELGGRLDELEGRRGVGPVVRRARGLGRRLAPGVRFAWGRLTPGDLGLELTTLLAVGAVGAFAFFGYLDALRPGAGPTPADRSALDVARSFDGAPLPRIAEVLSVLGEPWLVGALVVVAAGVLAARRELLEAAALLGGLALCLVVVGLGDGLQTRGAPPRPLVDAPDGAFPSTYAVLAVGYVALAVAAARAVPLLPARAALLVGAIVLAAAIGLARVLLRASWLSDALGGFGVGVLAFAAAAGVAVVVGHVRQDGRARPGGADPP